MDNYILVGSQEPVPPAPAVETPRRLRKAGFIGILFVGCGFLWQAALTTFAKGVGTPYNITGVYTEVDLVKIFGQGGPKPEHIFRRPPMMVSSHGEVDVDSDVNSRDIYQGQLGDCYFDAALAAVAHRYKDLIIEMFEHIDMSQQFFRTRWFMGGRWVTVAVNTEIPVDPNNHSPFFLWTSSQLTMWPAILEKSYAKLVGTYKGIESGSPAEALQYLLGVPVNQITDQSTAWSNIRGATDLIDVWNQIVNAVDNYFPIAVGTGNRGGFHGIHGGHAYTLYGISSDYQGHGPSVRVRNPWGHNTYAGTITGQTQSVGDFWITWDEFTRNYMSISIALLHPGYQHRQMISWPVSAVTGSSYRAVRFTVSHNDAFSVQAIWPPQRMTRAAHCQDYSMLYYTCPNAWTCPTRLLLYQGRRGSGSPTIGDSTVNGLRVDGQGAGTWIAELEMHGTFPGLPEITVSAYMPGSGALSLAEMPEPSSLPVSTLDAQLVSAKEAQHRVASLQPIETPSCSDYYSRLIHDMNGIVLPSDPHFPESEESIADAGVDCGDAAHGYRLPCSHFNHWEDMITVGNAETDDLSCMTFTRHGNQCTVRNEHCNRPAVFFCHIVGCDMNGYLNPSYGYSTLDASCCGCNDPSNFR